MTEEEEEEQDRDRPILGVRMVHAAVPLKVMRMHILSGMHISH